MKSVNPKIYDENFFLNCCLGSEEFKKSGGKELHPRVQKLFRNLNITKGMRILDLGCGRGDIALFLAKNAKECIGIDYSKDAIKIAKSAVIHFPKSIQNKINFKVMSAKKINFPDSYFDLIVCVDVFEHLYKEELEIAMKEISRVLKKDGILFTRTVTNKILYEYTYKYYIYPVSNFLSWIDQKTKNIRYNYLPRDPRVKEEKMQHVNEPTYFYLIDLFKRHRFKGNIQIEIGYLKNIKSLRSIIYNFLITLYPVSELFPLSLLFGWAFICKMKNCKKEN